MKAALILLLFGVSFALASTITGENGWYVPQVDGTFEWMTEEEAHLSTRNIVFSTRLGVTVKFYLYTRENQYDPELIEASIESLRKSKFSEHRATRILIHGWQSNYKSDDNYRLRTAYLKHGDYNVIVVDWSKNAETINYPLAAQRVKGVGKQVAAFIDFANQHAGLSFETLEVDGHSLGAHCAGFAGKNVKRGRIHTIRGLDPALPLFSYEKPEGRLNSGDAYYVETIQTNGGMLGFLKPIGKASFYPNGGKSQPGCGLDATGACAHSRSYIYYAEAILRDDFPSMKCSDYELAVSKDCGKTYSSNRLGAAANDNSAHGSYYTPVHKTSPYGMAA